MIGNCSNPQGTGTVETTSPAREGRALCVGLGTAGHIEGQEFPGKQLNSARSSLSLPSRQE